MLTALQASIGNKSSYPCNSGLDAQFREQLRRFPEKTAIIYGNHGISYSELHDRANAWAALLVELNLQVEEPVGLLLEPGIEQVVLQLGIIRAGGTCVPLDPAQPDSRLADMLQNLQSNILITTAACKHRLSVKHILLCEQQPELTKDIINQVNSKHRTHILHTSGTTGKPKAVQMIARGISCLVVNNHFALLTPDEKMAHISNPTFDASLFEVWGALLNGGTLVIIPKQTVVDPYALRDALQRHKITSICITTALFNLTALSCPDAFKGVNNVLVGGEAANAHALLEVLKHSEPPNLRNAYGPTESTTCAVTLKITLDTIKVGQPVSIGQAIDNTEAYILNSALKPVTADETGELYLGGDGLVRGYWNQENLNNERFITASPLGKSIRLYRTGDLARWNINGNIDYLGRIDNQIKLRGHRIELEEIESVLLRSTQLKGAVVDYIKPESEHSEPYLRAYLVPQSPDDFSADALQYYLKNQLPEYMQPRFEIVESIPLNPNGKADRKALAAQFNKQHQQFFDLAKQQTVLGVLTRLWHDILDISEIKSTDNFFELGASSLQAAMLIVAIQKQYHQRLPVQTLYDHATLASLADYIETCQQQGAGYSVKDDIATLRQDAHQADELLPIGTDPVDWLSPGEGIAILTGATGFLGAYFLYELLKNPATRKVYCLVRATSTQQAQQRIEDNLVNYNLWQQHFASRIEALPGELSDHWLGLGEQQFYQLAEQGSVIFHLGAHVDYNQPYATHRPANVTGTFNILRLANTIKVKPLHYVSSVAAYGPTGFFTGTRSLPEDEPLERHLPALKYDTGYSQSQWVAEQIARTAQKNGLPVAIYRPGFIMGDSERGIGNHKDFVARLIKGCLQMNAYPLLPRQSKEFISADYVCKALLNIAADNRNLGKAYNLVPLYKESATDLMGLFRLLQQNGHVLEALSYTDWVKKLEHQPTDNPLLPLLPMLAEQVYGNLTRWEVYENMPVYQTDNVEKALGDKAYTLYRELDAALLQRYLDSWKERGFLE